MLLDSVKLDGRFRLCYPGTGQIAMVAPGNPVDVFETVLDLDAAREGRTVWVLKRRSAAKAPGYINRGQADRAKQMIHDAGIVIHPQE